MEVSSKRYVVRKYAYALTEGADYLGYFYLTPKGTWHPDLEQAKRFRTQMDATRARRATTHHTDGGTIVKINDAITDDIVSKIKGSS